MPSPLPPHPTLLVVDDTPAALGVVCASLRSEGIRVLLAESAGAAREVLVRTVPDLILLDVMMPGEPAGRAIGLDLVLVLKSGSFGSPDFLRTAITFLHTLDP